MIRCFDVRSQTSTLSWKEGNTTMNCDVSFEKKNRSYSHSLVKPDTPEVVSADLISEWRAVKFTPIHQDFPLDGTESDWDLCPASCRRCFPRMSGQNRRSSNESGWGGAQEVCRQTARFNPVPHRAHRTCYTQRFSCRSKERSKAASWSSKKKKTLSFGARCESTFKRCNFHLQHKLGVLGKKKKHLSFGHWPQD